MQLNFFVNSTEGSPSEKQGLEVDAFPELAVWKSNYCDKIHSNRASSILYSLQYTVFTGI